LPATRPWRFALLAQSIDRKDRIDPMVAWRKLRGALYSHDRERGRIQSV